MADPGALSMFVSAIAATRLFLALTLSGCTDLYCAVGACCEAGGRARAGPRINDPHNAEERQGGAANREDLRQSACARSGGHLSDYERRDRRRRLVTWVIDSLLCLIVRRQL
jgi:hypothetical protein